MLDGRLGTEWRNLKQELVTATFLLNVPVNAILSVPA